MELLQLKYFCKVARLQHMTRAAEELHIAQPALSKTIRHLENELGAALFDRTGKYIRLNDYGRIFLDYAERALGAIEDGKHHVRDAAGSAEGTIRLAFPVGSHIVPGLLAEFRRLHPQITFTLIQQFSGMERPLFDLCISSFRQPIPDTESIPLIDEELFLAVPDTHPLANRTSVRLEEMANEPFIALVPGSSLRDTTDRLCLLAGFRPNIVFESDNPSTVRGLIRAGQGVAFIPAVSWEGSTGPEARLLHVESPECRRVISLSWYKSHYLSRAARLFREFTVDYFAGQASSSMD
ncbi:LysR family transcriptional regulator [Saccharibacillus sp. CPCC 101409]|uniref:LysR family transcriptional regulator n=1 Tax=Saccharibacillus sp. CPCC 101409 TaxID=3058041 RepID=UPI00267179E1|nr:LysR family transcriptional regulator [Saccharibacillus sp. CPCC 101409]MDO3410409.1 LysR family transcriptional regulator [Saccharibacillus sp. CPCC 101409]